MNQIKILHLFPQLLSLYGEYGNMAILKNALEEKGFSVTLEQCESGDADYARYDLCYMGSGTEDNLMVALERLLPHAQAVKDSLTKTLWLATGNAMALFGKALSRGALETAGLGVFDYTSAIDDSKRYLGDVLTADEPRSLGFINNSCVYTGITAPMHRLLLNPQLGNDKVSADEGIREGNFFGTQFIGPFLVKNPHYLEQFCSLLTGQAQTLPADSYHRKAYDVALTQLRKRAGLAD